MDSFTWKGMQFIAFNSSRDLFEAGLKQSSLALLDVPGPHPVATSRFGLGLIFGAILIFLAYKILSTLFSYFTFPIRDIPGPRIAAITRYYEFYYNAIKHFSYAQKVAELHQQYDQANQLTRCLVFPSG
jgi:hypothetical protein